MITHKYRQPQDMDSGYFLLNYKLVLIVSLLYLFNRPL